MDDRSGLDDLTLDRPQALDRALLIGADEERVARDIHADDGRKPALSGRTVSHQRRLGSGPKQRPANGDPAAVLGRGSPA